MLNYITNFEGAQNILVLSLGLVAAIFAVGFNVRRGMLVEDVKAENDMRRKIEWHNIEARKAIEARSETAE